MEVADRGSRLYEAVYLVYLLPFSLFVKNLPYGIIFNHEPWSIIDIKNSFFLFIKDINKD